MGNIRSNTIYLRKDGKTQKFIQKTRFSVSSEKFLITLPHWWTGTLGFNEVCGETLCAVDNAFAQAQKDFEELSTNKKKVIVYKVQFNVFLWEKGQEGEKCKLRKKDMHFVDGTALALWWTLAYKMTNKIKGETKYQYLNGTWLCDKDHYGYKIMEWTKKREEFFVALDKQLHTLIEGLYDFMNQDIQKLTLALDTFTNLNQLVEKKENETVGSS